MYRVACHQWVWGGCWLLGRSRRHFNLRLVAYSLTLTFRSGVAAQPRFPKRSSTLMNGYGTNSPLRERSAPGEQSAETRPNGAQPTWFRDCTSLNQPSVPQAHTLVILVKQDLYSNRTSTYFRGLKLMFNSGSGCFTDVLWQPGSSQKTALEFQVIFRVIEYFIKGGKVLKWITHTSVQFCIT